MQDRVSEMVDRFRHIGETNMKDLPIYHHDLEVEAIAFEPFLDGYAGVVITPWFMNFIYLPKDKGDWADLVVGQKINHKIGKNKVGFRINDDEVIGKFVFIPLHSPMYAFKNQDSARLTAFAERQKILTPEAFETDEDTDPQPAEVPNAKPGDEYEVVEQRMKAETGCNGIARRNVLSSIFGASNESSQRA